MKSTPKRKYFSLWFCCCLFSCFSSPQKETWVFETSAQSFPTTLSPSTLEEIPAGSFVQILDVTKEDAFFHQKESLEGKQCQVRGEDLEGWDGLFRGSLRCGNQPEFFFTEVRVALLQKETDFEHPSLKGKPFQEDEVPFGTKIKLLEFSPNDLLYPWPKEMQNRTDELLREYGNLLGEVCEVLPTKPLNMLRLEKQTKPPEEEAPQGLVSTGDNWYSGSIKCEGVGKKKLFIYQASIEVL